MFKNVAAKFMVFAFDATTNVPKTGDAANLTAYVSKDYGTVTVLGDTSATEMDATNAPGYYLFDAAQGETNADCLMISGKSSTSNIKVIGAPAVIYTRPTTGWLAPTTAGRTLTVDASGRALSDVDTIKTNPVVNGGTITFPTTATLASTTNITAGTITTATNLTNAPTAGDLTAAMKTSVTTAAAAATPTAAAVTGAVGSVTGLTASDVGAIKTKTDNLPSDPADESLIIAATDAIMTRIGANGASLTAVALTSAYDFAKGTVAMTESYNTDGAAPTPVQALMLALQMLTEKSVASTTLTVKKLDGSTTAATFTLNDATTPTAITRAS